MDKIIDKVNEIPFIATRDNDRYLQSTYKENINKQNKLKHKSSKHKSVYAKPVNKIKQMDDGSWTLKCYCCDNNLNLNDDGTHRCHNIPQSSGCDWSIDNIYLCCATCNLNMSNTSTVDEYKVGLFVKILKKNNIKS